MGRPRAALFCVGSLRVERLFLYACLSGVIIRSMSFNCTVTSTLSAEWLNIEPSRLGNAPQCLPTPDAYVLVENSGKPEKRLNIYFPRDVYVFEVAAICWCDWIVVGFGNTVCLVPKSCGTLKKIPISEKGDDYFSGFWHDGEVLIVVSGTGLVRIDPQGDVRWRNHGLGIDGVVLESVTPTTIKGSGEWDPPGGWRTFQISARTGR